MELAAGAAIARHRNWKRDALVLEALPIVASGVLLADHYVIEAAPGGWAADLPSLVDAVIVYPVILYAFIVTSAALVFLVSGLGWNAVGRQLVGFPIMMVRGSVSLWVLMDLLPGLGSSVPPRLLALSLGIAAASILALFWILRHEDARSIDRERSQSRDKNVQVPRAHVYTFAAAVAGLVFVLLAVIYYDGQHAWREFRADGSVAFFNTTDTLLCYKSGGPPEASCAAIRPEAESHWLNNSCEGQGGVTVYAAETQQLLYRRFADCRDWEGAFLIITRRDGKFLVVDSLPPSATHELR